MKKKSQSLAYYLIHERVVYNEWRIAYVDTNENEVDLLTKVLPHGEKRYQFIRMVLNHIFSTA